MSKSVGLNPLRAHALKAYVVPFGFTTNNTSAPTSVVGRGVASVAYNAATGRFLITLRDTYRKLMAFNAESIGTTYYKVNCYAVSNENSANAVTVEVVVLDGTFTAQDTTSVRIVGKLLFEDSDAA